MSMFHELMMRKKGMPSRYQEVEYIESTGTQYIDTGIIPANIPNLKIEFCISNFSSGRFGTQRNNYYGITNWALCPFITNNNSYIQLGGSGTEVSVSSTPLQKHNYFVDIENQKIIIDNQTEISTSFSTTNAIDNFFLFADNFNQTANNFASAKVYCFRFYSGSTLIRNFIPVYDTLTNKYGMWESVQGKFYGNDGTGDFKGSIVGYTVVGSPTITDGVVSGFSDSDYVLLNENIPFATGDVFIEMKYSVTSLSGTTLLGTYGSSRMQLKYSSNKLEFYWAGNQIINFSGFNLVDYQYIRVVSNYQGGTLEIYASVDGNNWSLITSASNVNWNYSQTYPTQFGRYPVSSDFAIDFNNTYIKLDGKLWFNGQQA